MELIRDGMFQQKQTKTCCGIFKDKIISVQTFIDYGALLLVGILQGCHLANSVSEFERLVMYNEFFLQREKEEKEKEKGQNS